MEESDIAFSDRREIISQAPGVTTKRSGCRRAEMASHQQWSHNGQVRYAIIIFACKISFIYYSYKV